MARYLTVVETAKLVRKALKHEFPGTKFSVRSDSYAGGASVEVEWTDGPTLRRVQKIANLYRGAEFDGMTDSMSYHQSLIAGPDGNVEEVSFGADFAPCQRTLSDAYKARLATKLEELTGEKFHPTHSYDFVYKGHVCGSADGWTALWQIACIDDSADEATA